MKILLTAFEPFGGDTVNPAQEAVALVADTVAGAQIVKIDVPVVFGKAIETVRAAMERALRAYNGKALINSVNGKQEVMDAIFPLMKKYGGAVIALTLDEHGIPADADGRVAIAERILAEAGKYGIGPRDVIFDPLAMTISAAPKTTRIFSSYAERSVTL